MVHKVLTTVLVLILILSILGTYYRYVIKKDFVIFNDTEETLEEGSIEN
ncbi:MAG: hypothetical protein RJA61_76 [Candidatus Parcubacteria bacterium]|jgi:hypothetical protein